MQKRQLSKHSIVSRNSLLEKLACSETIVCFTLLQKTQLAVQQLQVSPQSLME